MHIKCIMDCAATIHRKKCDSFILKICSCSFSYDHGCSKSSCDADVRLGIYTDFPKTDRKTKTKCIFSLQVMIAGVFLGEGEEKMIGVKNLFEFLHV